MTVTAVRKDPQALTMTLDAEFDASPERVWQLWADPRQLERWWGPPTYPATVTSHDLRARRPRRVPHDRPRRATSRSGFWDVVEVEPPASARLPRRLRKRRWHAEYRSAVHDGPRHDRGDRRRAHPDVDRQPVFPSVEAMEQLLAMGMEQGLTEAVGQIDAILAEAVARSA